MKLAALFSVLLPLAMAVPLATQPHVQPRTVIKRAGALPRLGGVNLAGCDFGMDTNGDSGTSECPPVDQVQHFVSDGANAFRLPVGWQYLIGSTTSAANPSLSTSFFPTYDALVTAVTGAGAYALIDIHNYARFNGGIIGQGGPTNEDFADLWTLIATQYKDNDLVMFGLMNEPHDLDIGEWATTCQAAVNAIRAAGATTQTIVVPGTSWDNAQVWSSGGDAPLLNVTDPAAADNSLLIFDVHKYLDSDGSGTSATCTTNGLDLLQPLATWLSSIGRKAILSETGAGNNAGCITDLGAELQYVAQTASDVFVGFTAWAAGSFATDYTLSLTPNSDGTDNALFVSAVQPYLPGASDAAATTGTTAAIATTTAASGPASSGPASSGPASSGPASSKAAATSSTSSNPAVIAIQTSSTSSAPASSTSSSAVWWSWVPPSSSSTWAASSSAPAVGGTPSSSPAAGTGPSSTSSGAAAAATGTNLQTYAEGLGGIMAPPVYEVSATSYVIGTGTTSWNSAVAAIDASCYQQMNSCQLAANQGGNAAGFTVWDCEATQINACLAAAN